MTLTGTAARIAERALEVAKDEHDSNPPDDPRIPWGPLDTRQGSVIHLFMSAMARAVAEEIDRRVPEDPAHARP